MERGRRLRAGRAQGRVIRTGVGMTEARPCGALGWLPTREFAHGVLSRAWTVPRRGPPRWCAPPAERLVRHLGEPLAAASSSASRARARAIRAKRSPGTTTSTNEKINTLARSERSKKQGILLASPQPRGVGCASLSVSSLMRETPRTVKAACVSARARRALVAALVLLTLAAPAAAANEYEYPPASGADGADAPVLSLPTHIGEVRDTPARGLRVAYPG